MTSLWAERYEHLPPAERADVNQEVDRRFRQRTHVSRTLDPNKDKALVAQWLGIRDEVMAQMGGKGSPDPQKTSNGLVFWLPSPMKNMAFLLLYNYDIGSEKPKAEHLSVLDRLMPLYVLAATKGQVEVRVGVIGHASRTGGETFDNQGLSDRRAAQVDKHLREIGGTALKFFKAGGTGSKEEVSKDPAYREAWPKLESLDEDERDRSVVVMIQWQAPGAIDAFNQPSVDWDKAFDQAAQRAAFQYAATMGLLIAQDYMSPIKVKGVDVPWNPITGWPTSWATGSPDADAVMQAMGPMILNDIEQAARNMNLKISRDEIISHYQDWLKSPKNKWVNP
jgi:outer membrane protein OmpA-like peptidoglycan-associated protein